MDLLLGGFADAWLHRLTAAEVREYGRLLDEGDPEIFDILFGHVAPGAYAALAERIRAHHGIRPEGSRDGAAPSPASVPPTARGDDA